MKKLLLSLFLTSVASNPCLATEVELSQQSFPVNLSQWDVKWGDTLSEITHTLLPEHKHLHQEFMLQTVKLNPNVFPTNSSHFMLAFENILFPSKVDENDMEFIVNDMIKRMQIPQTATLSTSNTAKLKANAPFVPLYQVSKALSKSVPIAEEIEEDKAHLFAINAKGKEVPFTSGNSVFNQYQYITKGEIKGAFKIKNGPHYVIEANSRIKVNLNKNGCSIDLIYGLIRVQDRSHFKTHCAINTKIAKITSINADYGVMVCIAKKCVISTKPEGLAILPDGLYNGVLRGKIDITDALKKHTLKKGNIHYYANDAKKPLNIKPFKGLIFSGEELATFNQDSKKQVFKWGYVQSNQIDSNSDNTKQDDIRTTFSTKSPNSEEKVIPTYKQGKDANTINNITPNRFQ